VLKKKKLPHTDKHWPLRQKQEIMLHVEMVGFIWLSIDKSIIKIMI